jgi:3-hydroxyacyl-[acyl-carrier-protein] dehydratase
MSDFPDDARELFARAQKQRLLEFDQAVTLMSRDQVMEWLPHRDPLLLVDRVIARDPDKMLLAGAYDLSRAAHVFEGHFPRHPIYPGVLQTEAIGQAGMLAALLAAGDKERTVALTHILGARFLAPVPPGGELQLVSQVLDDGLFMTVVGQAIKDGKICAVMASRALVDD